MTYWREQHSDKIKVKLVITCFTGDATCKQSPNAKSTDPPEAHQYCLISSLITDRVQNWPWEPAKETMHWNLSSHDIKPLCVIFLSPSLSFFTADYFFWNLYVMLHQAVSQASHQPSLAPSKSWSALPAPAWVSVLALLALLRRAHFLLIAGWEANSTSEPAPPSPPPSPPTHTGITHPVATVSFNQSRIVESEPSEL